MNKSFYDIESEQTVIAAILNNGFDWLPRSLAPDARLFSGANKLIFEAALDLYCEGESTDIIAVTKRLNKAGLLEKAGGHGGITQIMTLPFHDWSVKSAYESLREHFTRREAREAVKTLSDSLDNGDDPKEVLLAIEQIGERLELKGSRSGLPPIENALACVQTPPTVPPQIIRGLLHQGAKLVLGGGSKSYKTWCFADLALSIASGVPWWGFETAKGRVLYLNFELPAWSFAERLQSIARAKGDGLDVGNLDLWNLRGYSADLSVLAPKIIQKAKRSEYALIVLDPIYKCLGGRDENAAGDVGGLLNEIERIATETGAAVVFGAHFSKGNQAGKEAIDRISGSGVFARDPDAIVVLTPHEEADAYTVEATLRSLPRIEPFAVRWEFPLMRPDDQLDPAKLKQIAGRKRENTLADILKLLPDEGATTSEWQRLAHDEEGISRPTFMRLRKEAEASQRIYKSPITGKWIGR